MLSGIFRLKYTRGSISVSRIVISLSEVLAGKLALIITSNGKATAEAINLIVRRGATLLPAYGAYSGQQRELLMCVCSKSEIYKVKSAAQRVDPQAFMMITEASEIYGNGFKTS